MMQSLLLTGVSSAKNNEKINADVDGNTDFNDVNESKKFADVMEESLEAKGSKKQLHQHFIKGELSGDEPATGKLTQGIETDVDSLVIMTDDLKEGDNIEVTPSNKQLFKSNQSINSQDDVNTKQGATESLESPFSAIESGEKNTKIEVAGELNKNAEENSEENEFIFSKELADKVSREELPTHDNEMSSDMESSTESTDVAKYGVDLDKLSAISENDSQQKQLLSQIETAQQFNASVNNSSNDSDEMIENNETIKNKASNLDVSIKNSTIDATEAMTSKNNVDSNSVDSSIKSNVMDSAEMRTTSEKISSDVNNLDDSVKSDVTPVLKEVLTTASINGESDKINDKGDKETVLDSFIKSNEKSKLQLSNASEKAMQSLKDTVAEPNSELSDEEGTLKNESAQVPTKAAETSTSMPVMLRNESSAASQPVIDANGARPNQTSLAQLDKSIAVNQQAQTTNNLLQQPLDIQSKQAASMMGERVLMMISQGKQEVQIRLDPAELGSMMIKVQMQQDQVQLNIQTQAGLSKDIIEQNMPRLREQLAQQGIQLGEANVQQQSQQQGQSQRNMEANNGLGRSLNDGKALEEEQTPAWIPSKIPSIDQGIDFYA